jgi:hypothetical protein
MAFLGWSSVQNTIIIITIMFVPTLFLTILTIYNLSLILFMFIIADYNIETIDDLKKLPKNLLFRVGILFLIILMIGFPPSF